MAAPLPPAFSPPSGQSTANPRAYVREMPEGMITGEAVMLDVKPAGFVLRATGGLIDYILYMGAFIASAIGAIYWLGTAGADDAAFMAVLISLLVMFVFVIPTAVEIATRGRSLGKLIVGARIVRDDGGAISVRHAIVRGLTGAIEIYLTAAGLAILIGLLNSKSKRMGDLLAGTYSQLERVPQPVEATRPLPMQLQDWAAVADVAKLPDRLSRRIAHFLAQAERMLPASRLKHANELANEASRYVSPMPLVDPETFLVAVAALRRDRELRRLIGEQKQLARFDPIFKGLPHGFPQR